MGPTSRAEDIARLSCSELSLSVTARTPPLTARLSRRRRLDVSEPLLEYVTQRDVMNVSSPRLVACTQDWPRCGQHRCDCVRCLHVRTLLRCTALEWHQGVAPTTYG